MKINLNMYKQSPSPIDPKNKIATKVVELDRLNFNHCER